AAVGAAETSPFKSEILDGKAGYLRVGSLNVDNLAGLDAALQDIAAKKIGAVILDLRATPAGSEFAQAAEVCKRFCPKGKVLFTVKKPTVKEEQILTSKEDPKFTRLLVALVDIDTAGAAEIIAAVLRTHAKAMVIGQRTRGEAVEFSDIALPSGKLLRVAVAEAALPDATPVFPGGVKPDLAVEVSQETTRDVLKQGLESGIAALVEETERDKMNEAALVGRRNPELDAMQAAQARQGEKTKAPLRDVVLQRALDFISTIGLYEKKPASGAK
ncbi:MAG: S41 family peptidase, partial [Chthoniobacteraceae bacterium]